MAVIWRDPPAAARRGEVIAEVAAIVKQLRERPHEWAEVARCRGASGASRRKELLVAADCEVVTSRGETDVERIVFARYIGTNGAGG